MFFQVGKQEILFISLASSCYSDYIIILLADLDFFLLIILPKTTIKIRNRLKNSSKTFPRL
jgi:hypothetical protein